MPKTTDTAQKLSFMEVMSKAAKQAKLDDEMEDEDTDRKEKSNDYLTDFTAHEGHSHAVFCVAFHPEGRLLLSASGDKTVKLWDLQTTKVLATFIEHEQWVYSVAFMHDVSPSVPMAFATGCDDGRVRIYENDTQPLNHETGWKLMCDLGHGGKHDPANGHLAGVQSVDVSRDDAYVVSASADMTIKVWRRHEKECFMTLRGHTDWVTRAVFDSDGLMVVSSSYDKHAKLWRLSDGEEQLTFYGHDSWISDVAFSPEGRSIATASGDFTVRLWQVKTRIEMVSERGVTSVKEQLADGMPLVILYGHKNWVLSVNFSADGKRLCSSSADRSCIVWDIAQRKVQHRIKHAEWVEYAAFAPAQSEGLGQGQGQHLSTSIAVAACGHDIDIRLWNVASDQHKIIAVLSAQLSYVALLYFWLRSLIFGGSWKSPPLSHQRHAALQTLFNRLDPNEEDSVEVAQILQLMGEDPLLKQLLEQPENGADLMHTQLPRSVHAALTQWSLSASSHIRWQQLLALFMDPEAAVSTNLNDGELTGSLSVAMRALRRSTGLGRGSRSSSAAPSLGQRSRSAASRHRSGLRKLRGASASSSSSEEEEEEEEDLRRSSAIKRSSRASRGDDDRPAVAFADEVPSRVRVVELLRTPISWGLSLDRRYTVLAIAPGSQAERSGGFALNDRLLSLNGVPLSGGASSWEAGLGAFTVGTTVAVEVEVRRALSGAATAPSAASVDARLSTAKGKQPVLMGAAVG